MKKTILEKIKEVFSFVWETKGSLITLLIPILISVDVIKDYLDKHKLLWILAVVLFVLGYFLNYKYFESRRTLNNKTDKLEQEKAHLIANLESIPDNMIKKFTKYFELNDNYRVTLYRIKDNQSFKPVARYSESPIYRDYGRNEYPIDKGFIGQCWKEGEVKKENLPSYENSPEKYKNVTSEKSNMSTDVIENLTMKSSSFYCKRLSYNTDQPIAIIVVESTKTRLGVNIDDIRSFLNSPFGKVLIDTVKMNSFDGK